MAQISVSLEVILVPPYFLAYGNLTGGYQRSRLSSTMSSSLSASDLPGKTHYCKGSITLRISGQLLLNWYIEHERHRFPNMVPSACSMPPKMGET